MFKDNKSVIAIVLMLMLVLTGCSSSGGGNDDEENVDYSIQISEVKIDGQKVSSDSLKFTEITDKKTDLSVKLSGYTENAK